MAADMGASSPGHDLKAMEKMDTMGSMEAMNKGEHNGVLIRETEVDGYHLAYHLIDMQEQIEKMKAAGHTHEMKPHHLMVYVTYTNGAPVGNAEVGYLIENPDGSKQKAMCMAMADGFGADVDFTSPDAYKVKTKIAMADKTIMDTFEYMSH